MEIIYHIKSDVACVYLLNGSFVEAAGKVTYRVGEPLYITVLPLEAIHLPYTVKIMGVKVLSNNNLVDTYSLGIGRVYVHLKARYNYVYTPHGVAPTLEPLGVVPRFFKAVKDKQFALARECLTHELGSTVTDEALTEFFNEYSEATENIFTGMGGWFLLRLEGDAALCDIKLRSGLIDNFEIS